MSKTPQRSFKSTYCYRNISVNLPQFSAIHNNGTVRTLSGFSSGRIRVIRTLSLCGCIMCNHGINISRCHKKGIFRSTKPCEITAAVPIRLSDNSHCKTHSFNQPCYDCRPEARMINIRITRYKYKIKLFNTQLVHFLSRHRKKSFVHYIPPYVYCSCILILLSSNCIFDIYTFRDFPPS